MNCGGVFIFMVKKNTTLYLDKNLLKTIKIQAVKEDLTQTDLITRYLIDGLKNDGVEL